jgi:ParB family transcriptional regulator, chromosome partitioning protein
MSTKRGNRPTDIGASLSLGNLDDAARARRAETRPRTAAGELLAERRTGLESENALLQAQVGELQAEVQKWSGASPVMPLDPNVVEPSRFANRLVWSFGEPGHETAEFLELKEEIRLTNGNVQPIKVAPIPGSTPQRYTIVFGHRRHRACQQLGIPVNAIIENLSESDQFVEMAAENRAREDLSAYELGIWVVKATSPVIPRQSGDEPGWALFDSMATLASRVDLSKANVSKAVQIAKLPVSVIEAFERPTDIQFNWATLLNRAKETDLTALMTRAKDVVRRRSNGEVISSKDTYRLLTSSKAEVVEQGGERVLKRADGSTIGRLVQDKKGLTRVELAAPLDDKTVNRLSELLVKLFDK